MTKTTNKQPAWGWTPGELHNNAVITPVLLRSCCTCAKNWGLGRSSCADSFRRETMHHCRVPRFAHLCVSYVHARSWITSTNELSCMSWIKRYVKLLKKNPTLFGGEGQFSVVSIPFKVCHDLVPDCCQLDWTLYAAFFLRHQVRMWERKVEIAEVRATLNSGCKASSFHCHLNPTSGQLGPHLWFSLRMHAFQKTKRLQKRNIFKISADSPPAPPPTQSLKLPYLRTRSAAPESGPIGLVKPCPVSGSSLPGTCTPNLGLVSNLFFF